ncbi:hypothetical protein EDC96DRAFT_534114 [Choanephora cucurbitarum]|nr:hypothetical protein EDC96DRAFT_534114 [Choanephora cucurbitarum]
MFLMATIKRVAFLMVLPILPLPASCFSSSARTNTYFLTSMIRKLVTSALMALLRSSSTTSGKLCVVRRRIPKVPESFAFSFAIIFEEVSLKRLSLMPCFLQ